MHDISTIDYSDYDRWDIGKVLFYPRPDWTDISTYTGASTDAILIPVETDIVVGARFHHAGKKAATILFFHGNGEIVADYDDMGPVYNKIGINFFPVDYRGYGMSTGTPTVTAMMRDCHVIFNYVRGWLKDNGYGGPLMVMGRSLGSASALELASHYPEVIAGLIIESGFAYMGPLLRLMGIHLELLGLSEENGVRNLEKMSRFTKPALIIHAEYDQIIPFAEGKALYDACPSADKRLLKVPGANHNDIFFQGMVEYVEAVKWIAETCRPLSSRK